MKIADLKNLLLSNYPLKIISLFLGYSFWYIASNDKVITLSLTVPLCFNQTVTTYSVQAPEEINITLQATRSAFYTLDKEFLMANVNIHELLPGKHGILLNDQHLFLPNTISLVEYKPSNLTITIINNETIKEI